MLAPTATLKSRRIRPVAVLQLSAISIFCALLGFYAGFNAGYDAPRIGVTFQCETPAI